MGRWYTSIIEETVKFSKPINGVVDHSLHIGFQRNIRFQKFDFVTEPISQFASVVFSSGSDKHGSAFLREDFHGPSTDATCSSRNNCHLVFQTSTHNFLLDNSFFGFPTKV
jgi:hypothetical protein